jgi:hypothetical protein
VFIAFSTSSGRKKVATSPTTRSFKPSILSHQPSTTTETTVIRILALESTRINPFWPGISPKNFTPSNSDHA